MPATQVIRSLFTTLCTCAAGSLGLAPSFPPYITYIAYITHITHVIPIPNTRSRTKHL